MRGTEEERPSPWLRLWLLYLNHAAVIKTKPFTSLKQNISVTQHELPHCFHFRKSFKFLPSLSEEEQVGRPKFTVEWKFSSPSGKLKELAET